MVLTEKNIDSVWLDDEAIHIKLKDGREASELFNDYPRLRNATKEQRQNFYILNYGLRWDDIDEDLSIDGFFRQKAN